MVGFYASLVDINAYHQPGVEAGKKAATSVLALKLELAAALKAEPGTAFTAEALAAKVGGDPELAFKLLEHLAANGSVSREAGPPWPATTYRAKPDARPRPRPRLRNFRRAGTHCCPGRHARLRWRAAR